MLIICWISYKLFRFFMFNLLVHSQLYWWQVFYQYGRQSSVFWGAVTLFYWWCHQMGFLLFVIRLPISKNVWFNHLMIKRVPGWIGTEKIGMTFTQNEKKKTTLIIMKLIYCLFIDHWLKCYFSRSATYFNYLLFKVVAFEKLLIFFIVKFVHYCWESFNCKNIENDFTL